MLELGIWALVGMSLFVVAGIMAAELDSAFISVATFVFGLLTVQYGFGLNLWAIFLANPLMIIIAVFLYLIAGALYTAFWRWPEFIRNSKDDIMEKYMMWSHELDTNADNSFDAYLDSQDYSYNVSQHKERLGTWVGLWPFSFAWEISRKPAIWLWNVSYYSLGSMLQKIGRNTARKLHDKG